MFSFAAYLGAANATPLHGVAGALLGLVAIFLPGMLVMVGALPFWDRLRANPGAQGAMHGIQASVVGLLAATLLSPVASTSIRTVGDGLIAIGGFALLMRLGVRPLVMVALTALATVAVGLS
jgi:chromate transporter